MLDKELTKNREEGGNALFLILIAVALFAALSYAITQSGRGSGTVNKETNIVVSGQVVEEPAAVRTAITRMIITGTTATNICFGCTGANDVFDTATGGGATNVAPPSGACVAATDCAAWVYVPATAGNGNFIYGVGTSASEGLAVLQGTSGVTSSICSQIQKGLGFASPYTPPVGTGGPVLWGTNAVYNAAGSASTVKSTTTALDGQAFACFQNTTANLYAYYHALIEQ